MATRRRGYFKHFNDASQGQTLQRFFTARAYREACLFWAIIERANQLNASEFTERIDYFTRILNLRPSTFERVSTTMCSLSDNLVVEIHGNFAQISLPNYAKYQDLRANNAQQIRSPLKIKDKRLNILYRDNANKINNRFLDLCMSLGKDSSAEEWRFYNQWRNVLKIDRAAVQRNQFDRTAMRDKIEKFLIKEAEKVGSSKKEEEMGNE